MYSADGAIMALSLTDMPLELLREYRPTLDVPGDLDEFWQRTVSEARSAEGTVEVRPLHSPFTELIVEDLTFPGFAGEPVRGWITRPRTDSPLPTVVEYVGYNGGRGVPGEKLAWAASGFVHVLMDTRGQGSGWGNGGATADPHGSGPATAGFMTRGIEGPETYYYRRVYTDAVRLLDHVAALDFVDASRIAVSGASQGGGITLAAAALSDIPFALLPDVPFLCDFPRAITRTPEPPFTEITRYLSIHRDRVEDALRTLSYFDGAVLAAKITQPALFSVALMDEIVLPSTVFAAYNALTSTDKQIEIYAFNGHEGGSMRHWHDQVGWLRHRL
jgi:cephalosporin-C deacetylase